MDHFLNGVEARPSRSSKCVRATTHALSALSDQAFVASYQRSAATSDGWALLKHLKESFVENLESVGWMDHKTQEAALRKARKLLLNLGGPEVYETLPLLSYPVTATSYWNNSRWVRGSLVSILRTHAQLPATHCTPRGPPPTARIEPSAVVSRLLLSRLRLVTDAGAACCALRAACCLVAPGWHTTYKCCNVS